MARRLVRLRDKFDMAKKRDWKVIRRYLTRSARDTESLSRGVGLGIFIGLLPSVGFQVVLAFFLAGFLSANRVVAVLGTLITNPFTTIPLSVFSLWVGDLILPGSTLANYQVEGFTWSEISSKSSNLLSAYLIGCLALSRVGGSLSYLVMRVYFASDFCKKTIGNGN